MYNKASLDDFIKSANEENRVEGDNDYTIEEYLQKFPQNSNWIETYLNSAAQTIATEPNQNGYKLNTISSYIHSEGYFVGRPYSELRVSEEYPQPYISTIRKSGKQKGEPLKILIGYKCPNKFINMKEDKYPIPKDKTPVSPKEGYPEGFNFFEDKLFPNLPDDEMIYIGQKMNTFEYGAVIFGGRKHKNKIDLATGKRKSVSVQEQRAKGEEAANIEESRKQQNKFLKEPPSTENNFDNYDVQDIDEFVEDDELIEDDESEELDDKKKN